MPPEVAQGSRLVVRVADDRVFGILTGADLTVVIAVDVVVTVQRIVLELLDVAILEENVVDALGVVIALLTTLVGSVGEKGMVGPALVAVGLEHAGRVLRHGSELHIWTDVEEYFNESMAAVHATGLFGEEHDERASLGEHDLDYRTHFERRTRLAGEPVWRAVLKRNDRAPRFARVEIPALG